MSYKREYQTIYIYSTISPEECKWFEVMVPASYDREQCERFAWFWAGKYEQITWDWQYQRPKVIYCETGEAWD